MTHSLSLYVNSSDIKWRKIIVCRFAIHEKYILNREASNLSGGESIMLAGTRERSTMV